MLYHIKNTLTGHLYLKQAVDGAPVGFAAPGPGLAPVAVRLPIARATIHLLGYKFKARALVAVAAPPLTDEADAGGSPAAPDGAKARRRRKTPPSEDAAPG
jgi:hypothetical protein